MPSLSVARKPASLSHVEAAGVPRRRAHRVGLVVETAHAHEGQRILIHAGSGGVGHFAVQFAAYFGAHVTVDRLGAQRVRGCASSARRSSSTTRRRASRMSIADVDVVIDLVGNVRDETGTRSLQVLRPGGLYILVPTGPGRATRTRQRRPACGPPATRSSPTAARSPRSARLLDSGAVQVYIDKVFDLRDAADAHAELEKGHTRGKIVLRVSDD